MSLEEVKNKLVLKAQYDTQENSNVIKAGELPVLRR
jgi:hypothetical protein